MMRLGKQRNIFASILITSKQNYARPRKKLVWETFGRVTFGASRHNDVPITRTALSDLTKLDIVEPPYGYLF